MADAITVISGALNDVVVTPPELEHYHPDVTATISVQGFVPVAAIPRTILVRARQAVGSVPASITCRVFDSVGNPVFVQTPIVSVDGTTHFANFGFAIAGSSVFTFPAFSIYTVELDLSRVDLCGLLICYKPSFPMVCEGNATAPNCLTTTVIS